jgi:two-component system NtrC family sensor kinase
VELAEEAMSLIRPQKEFRRVNFAMEVAPDLPAVQTDPDLVRQVLVNLLINALDAVGEGGHVWFRATAMAYTSQDGIAWPGHDAEPDFFEAGAVHRIQPPRDGQDLGEGRVVVVFSVVDDGPGIPEANLGRVFDPFYSTKEPGKGTGLGLAICHAAVQALGGEIWAWSKAGQGTQMAFYLPAANPAEL